MEWLGADVGAVGRDFASHWLTFNYDESGVVV